MERPKAPKSFYFDTSAILCFVNGEEGHEVLSRVIQAVDAGQVDFWVSAIHLVEARGEPRRKPIDHTREARLLSLFDNPRGTFIEFDRSVALRARKYTRAFGLKNYDAIHLACAVEAEADVLFALDGDFPFDTMVENTWVSKPYNPFDPDLFAQDS